jgi:hypothetical protein
MKAKYMAKIQSPSMSREGTYRKSNWFGKGGQWAGDGREGRDAGQSTVKPREPGLGLVIQSLYQTRHVLKQIAFKIAG